MSSLLHHSPADITSRGIIALGLGNHPGVDGIHEASGTGTQVKVSQVPWPVFVGDEPNNPDNVITVYDTVGTHEGREMIGGETQQHYGIQVRVRARRYDNGYEKANAIHTAMGEVAYRDLVQIGSFVYRIHCYSKIRGIMFLPRKPTEEDWRSRFVFNALVSIEMVTLN